MNVEVAKQVTQGLGLIGCSKLEVERWMLKRVQGSVKTNFEH